MGHPGLEHPQNVCESKSEKVQLAKLQSVGRCTACNPTPTVAVMTYSRQGSGNSVICEAASGSAKARPAAPWQVWWQERKETSPPC